jgi:hypothetical protein
MERATSEVADAMTDSERIVLLRNALDGMLALVDERYAADRSRHCDSRIAEARQAIALTAPMKESLTGQPSDRPDVWNDLTIASQQLAAFAEIVQGMNEVFVKGIITNGGA